MVWDGSRPLLEQIKARSGPFRLSQQQQAQQYALLDPQVHAMVDAIAELARISLSHVPVHGTKMRKLEHVEMPGAPSKPSQAKASQVKPSQAK